MLLALTRALSLAVARDRRTAVRVDTAHGYVNHLTDCSQRLFAGSEPLLGQSCTPSTVRRTVSRAGTLSGCWARCSVGCRFRLFPHGRSAYLASAL